MNDVPDVRVAMPEEKARLINTLGLGLERALMKHALCATDVSRKTLTQSPESAEDVCFD